MNRYQNEALSFNYQSDQADRDLQYIRELEFRLDKADASIASLTRQLQWAEYEIDMLKNPGDSK